jgi:hypothetical protein
MKDVLEKNYGKEAKDFIKNLFKAGLFILLLIYGGIYDYDEQTEPSGRVRKGGQSV